MEEKPVVYIFHGDDEWAINQAVGKLYNQLGDPVTADMNTTHLDGSTSSDNDLLKAAATMPFLAERRLVIMTSPLSRLKEKESHRRFCSILEKLPPSAALVLVIHDQQRFRQGSWQWETLHDKHWLCEWAGDHKTRVFIKAFALPNAGEMPAWVQAHAREMGGKFDLDAAQELAGLVENNTRIAEQEVRKLLTYVNYERSVTVKDVQNLTAFHAETSIFEMVDAIAQGNSNKSLELLHRLLEDQDEYSLFPMIVRQFRQLIQARELLDEGKGVDQIQRVMQVQPFVAKKITYQAGRFSMPRLLQLYGELLQIDIAGKTGEMPTSLALDIFITNLS